MYGGREGGGPQRGGIADPAAQSSTEVSTIRAEVNANAMLIII